VNLVALE